MAVQLPRTWKCGQMDDDTALGRPTRFWLLLHWCGYRIPTLLIPFHPPPFSFRRQHHWKEEKGEGRFPFFASSITPSIHPFSPQSALKGGQSWARPPFYSPKWPFSGGKGKFWMGEEKTRINGVGRGINSWNWGNEGAKAFSICAMKAEGRKFGRQEIRLKNLPIRLINFWIIINSFCVLHFPTFCSFIDCTIPPPLFHLLNKANFGTSLEDVLCLRAIHSFNINNHSIPFIHSFLSCLLIHILLKPLKVWCNFLSKTFELFW